LDLAAAPGAQAIVILGGGVRHEALEYGGHTLGRLTLERTRYGARVAKQTGLPVLVSGGAPSGGIAEAEVMRAALAEEFGVPVRWVETGRVIRARTPSIRKASFAQRESRRSFSSGIASMCGGLDASSKRLA
jgi:uncharacterized SAM-binding protein YcdF (DUF218 family)